MDYSRIIAEIDAEIKRLQQARALLLGGAGPVAHSRASQPARKTTMSAAARRRISIAQKARWAKVKKGKP
jgi:hypothetical protein